MKSHEYNDHHLGELKTLMKQINMLEQRVNDQEIDIQNLYRRSEGWPILPPYDENENDRGMNRRLD